MMMLALIKMGQRAKKLTQMELGLEEPRRHGGRRAGAGRKPTGTRRGALHRVRARVTRHQAVHVTLPIAKAVGRMRRPAGYAAVRRGVAACIGRTDFRIVHVSIQTTHIHLLVEADDKGALSRGMRAFTTACARQLNKLLERRGRVFAGRYHATVITSPRQARHTLAYVLNNWRRHREHLGGDVQRRTTLDPYSSAPGFRGWSVAPQGSALPPAYEPLPVAGPRSWLLAIGWRRHSLIHPREVPGPDPTLAPPRAST